MDRTRREFVEHLTAAALLAGLPGRSRAQEPIPEELLAATRVAGPEQPVIGTLNGIPFTGSPRSIPGLDDQFTKIMAETGIPGFSFAVSRYVWNGLDRRTDGQHDLCRGHQQRSRRCKRPAVRSVLAIFERLSRDSTWPTHDLWPDYGFREPALAFAQ